MAGYVTTNPPAQVAGSVSGGPALWAYSSAGDTHATVAGAGYFSNGSALGMRVGDIVFVVNGSTSGTMHVVTTVTAGGAATVLAATLV